MHDLDRTQLEIEDQESGEMPENFELTGETEVGLNDEVVEELAGSLLEVSDEQELDQFLGDLIKRVGRTVRGAINSPVGQALGGLLKGAVKKALPIAGGALGGLIAPGIGSQIGSKLGGLAGNALGLEVGEEDEQFEVAKGLVRLADAAVQNVAQIPNATADPKGAARAAIIAAAKIHAPGLLTTQAGAGGQGQGGRARSGRWYRRAGKIVLVGV